MPGITTPYNLQMPSAGLIGRGSGAGRSTIMDAAAIRALTDTLTSTEVVNAISAGLATIDLSGKVSKSGDTMTGALSLGSNTLNCGAITASSTLTLQNATTAVLAEISKTYTSSTDREYLSLGYNSGLTGYFIGSRVGSAGGTARALKIGHLAANGTTFIGLMVRTDGNVQMYGANSFYDTAGQRQFVFGGSFIQIDQPIYQINPIYNSAKSTVTIPNNYGSMWVAAAGGTKDGVTYAVGDVLITTVTGSVSKTKIIGVYATM